MAQTIEIPTPKGILLLNVSVLSVEGDQHDAPKQQESPGYQACVAECHKVLDTLGISSEKEECFDRQCKSTLGHRLRKLQKLYLDQQSLILAISAAPEQARDILKGSTRAH